LPYIRKTQPHHSYVVNTQLSDSELLDLNMTFSEEDHAADDSNNSPPRVASTSQEAEREDQIINST